LESRGPEAGFAHIALIRIKRVNRAPAGTDDHEAFSFGEGFSSDKRKILRDQIMEIHPTEPETARVIACYAQYVKGSSASPAT
jgi:hypothetical protein